MRIPTTARVLFAFAVPVFILWGLSLRAEQAHAGSPLFSIGEGGERSWEELLADPSSPISPASDLTAAAIAFYDEQIGQGNYEAITPTLGNAGVSDATGETHDSLVMSWDDPPGVMSVASWDYTYASDPDLSGTTIHFSARAPQGIWDLSLELIDEDGNSRGWFRANPPSDWNEYWIDPNIEDPQDPFGSYEQPGDFDITRVVTIRLNESTEDGESFTELDPITGLREPWNAWNHLSVMPEPATTHLALTGLFAILLARRRRQPS